MSKKEEEMKEGKKSDKKSIVIGITFMVGCFIVGVISGFCSKMFTDSNGFLSDLPEKFTAIINSESYYVGMVVSVGAAIIAFILYRQSRKAYEIWEEDDDEAMDKIERKLSFALIMPNTALIVTSITTAIGLGQMQVFFEDGEFAIVKCIILSGGLLFSYIVALVLNSSIVNFEKEMNPEKRGTVFELNFHKKWMESSDEAEKLIAYKCGFAAYKTTNSVCSLLLLVCMFGMSNTQWGNAPVLMVGGIWLASYLSYSGEALKLSKKR